MTSDVQERGGPPGAAREDWLGGAGAGGDVPGRVLGSIRAGRPFTVVTGAQNVASDLVMATVDRLHAAHIETTTILAPLPNLAALTRAISTALSVVVDTERPLVVIVRQADALRPDAILRLPALAGLQRGGRPVLCFLLLGKPELWAGLTTIGLGALEQDDTAHIRLATPDMFQPAARHPEPAPPRSPAPQAPEPAARPRRPRRARIVVPAGFALGGALLAAFLATHRTPPAIPDSGTVAPRATAPGPAIPAAPATPLRPVPDLSGAAPAPPTVSAPVPPPLLALPDPAPEPAAMPLPPRAPLQAAAAPPPTQHLDLPDAGMLHIILRYSQGDDAAQAHAARVAGMLRAAGATVDGPVAAPDTEAPSSIGYFFAADRGAADRLAHRLPAHFVHIRSPFGPANTMMRPGELIVTIGPGGSAH